MPMLFDTALLSASWRPLFDSPLDTAGQFARAFALRAGRAELAQGVKITYVAEAEFLASAWAEGADHHIEIAAAVPAILIGIFFEVVRFTHPFSMDDQCAEGESAEPGSYRIPRLLATASHAPEDIAAAIERMLGEAMPEHKWQRILACTLAELALVYVVSHELGHVVYGHTAVLGQHRGIRLSEVRVATDSGPPRRVSQAWELQADRVAFSFLWSYVFQSGQQKRLLRQLKCPGNEPALELLGRVCYALSFVFLLLGQGDRRVRAMGSHPAPLVRMTFLATMAATIAEAKYPEWSDRVFDTVIRGHDLAEAAWNRLGLEFGVDRYREHIEELPAVISAAERQLRRVERTFRTQAWAAGRSDR